jgi:hypothetical protein
VLFYIDVKIGHHRGELYLLFRWTKGLSWKWNKIHCDSDGRCADLFIFILCIIIDAKIWFLFKTAFIYMIKTCAGIDTYTFWLDFKRVLYSTPQVFVNILTFTKRLQSI